MPARIPAALSAAEERLALQVRVHPHISDPIREHRFHPTRKWRFDFAWPSRKLAVEVEGLTAGGGRHQRLAGYEADCEKYAEALLLGWRVLRVTPRQVKSGDAFEWLARLYTMQKGD